MSRCLTGLAVVILCVLPAVGADDARTIVEKAVKAHGGADVLNKFKAGESKMKGQLTIFDMDLEFTGAVIYELPSKFKMTIETEVAGQKTSIVQVVDGDKVKQTVNGMIIPPKEAEKAELIQAAAMQEISQITPLLNAEKFTLKLEKDEDVEGRPAAVVLVTGKNFKDTKLYFDKQSGLLVKTSRRGLAPSMGDPLEVTEVTILSDFKDVQGVKVPMKMIVHHDGKKFMAVTVSDAKMMERADAKEFSIDD
jgi:hypothetical protein